MISPEELLETWSILETLSPSIGELQVREADLEVASRRVLFGVNPQKHWHVLIPVLSGTKLIEDRSSSGVQIRAHKLLDRGRMLPFVDLVCLKPHLHKLFSIIICEVLNALKTDSQHPDRTCQQILNRWRELLKEEPNPLGIEKLIGLFGEMWHLREMVRRDPMTIQFWKGPEGYRHDFSTGKIAIEVKTTLSQQGRQIEIHGHRQMEPPEGGKLYLATLKLEPVSAMGESIQDIVNSTLSYGVDHFTLLMLLRKVDISLTDLEPFKDIRFRIFENHIYEVTEDFPCITSKSFACSRLPHRVASLNYQIDLSLEPPYPLQREAIAEVYDTIASEVNT